MIFQVLTYIFYILYKNGGIKLKRRFVPFLLISLFFIMLAKPHETFLGASEGLLLWFQIVLPTLFPFIIITNLLVRTNTMYYFSRVLAPILGPLFHTSPYGSFAVLTGFLCGYPMGAKTTADLVNSNKITKKEGAYLLSFCNNTSPMFIMNYVILKNLKREDLLFPSMLILFLSPVLCSFLFRRHYMNHSPHKNSSTTYSTAPRMHFDFQVLDITIMNGFETITKVGGYIILFSVLVTLAEELPFHSDIWTLLILPSLEVTTGIPMITAGHLAFPMTFILVLALTSFGGMCSIAQTQCMIQETGLKIVPYITEKLITAIVTSFLALIYLQL